MVKCVKLPVIQVCTAFGGILPGSLRGQNRVVPRMKNSIFTIATLVKKRWEIYSLFRIFTMRSQMWTTGDENAGTAACNLILDFFVISFFSTEIKAYFPQVRVGQCCLREREVD
jgi:hypothetical protein